MRVNEIFSSVEGEGIRTGELVTFIRLYGCNLACSYCDTRYSCEGDDYTERSAEQILSEVQSVGIKNITLTGGEPLLHEGVKDLVISLCDAGHQINIETNGSVDIYPYISLPNVILTMDYKSKSSGMNDKMLLKNIKYLRPQDVLKFVVGNKEDLEDMLPIIQQQPTCYIYISPIFSAIEPAGIVDFMKQHRLENCRVQVQLHKIIWEPNQRGV